MDSRLVGETAENIFLSLLNERGVFAVSFDSTSFDGIVFDPENTIFRYGKSPLFVQIKCRGSKTSDYNPQGHSIGTVDKIKKTGEALKIPAASIYFVVGFYLNSDIRQIQYFGIPFRSLETFKTETQYRFSVSKCMEAITNDDSIFRI